MPIDKLEHLSPSLFDILLFEPTGEREAERLKEIYTTLEKDNMVSHLSCCYTHHFKGWRR